MPVVPTLNEPRVQPARAPGIQLSDNRPDIGGIAGQGIEGLGQILQQEQLKADRTAVTAAETQRESWANTALYDPTDGAFNREGANALGVTNDVLSAYDQQTKDIAKNLRGSRQIQAFTESSLQHRVALQGQLARFEFDQRGKYEDQTAASRISTAIDSAALNYNDPVSLGQNRAAILGVLQTQKQAKGWDEVTFQDQRAKATSALHEAVITNMLAQRDIPKAQAYLNANAGEIDAVGRVKALDHIDSTMRSEWMDMERLQSLSDKKQKQAADMLSKDGDRLLANGQLTADWIEKNRNLMEPNDYRYFYTKLAGGGDAKGVKNVARYADLMDRAIDGQDVSADARAALVGGDIDVSHYDILVNKGERPGWYKRGADYIKSMSGMSLLNPPVDAPQRYARMTDEWNDWASAHKDATDSQAQIAYQDLVASRLLVDRAGLPPMKYLIGDALQPDIQATAKATKKAFDDGQLSLEDYQRQQDIIVKYSRTMIDRTKKKAP